MLLESAFMFRIVALTVVGASLTYVYPHLVYTMGSRSSFCRCSFHLGWWCNSRCLYWQCTGRLYCWHSSFDRRSSVLAYPRYSSQDKRSESGITQIEHRFLFENCIDYCISDTYYPELFNKGSCAALYETDFNTLSWLTTFGTTIYPITLSMGSLYIDYTLCLPYIYITLSLDLLYIDLHQYCGHNVYRITLLLGLLGLLYIDLHCHTRLTVCSIYYHWAYCI